MNCSGNIDQPALHALQCSIFPDLIVEIIVNREFFIFVVAIENAIKNKLVRSPFSFYVIELDECASGSDRIIGEIVRYMRGGGRKARKRKEEIEVNRTNDELLGSRFHSTSTRLRNPLPSPYHPSITTAIRIRDCRDDRVDGDGSGNPQEADSKKVEDVSPSIKLPCTRERRPPGYVASKTSLSSTSTFLFFLSFFALLRPRSFFRLVPTARKRPCPRRFLSISIGFRIYRRSGYDHMAFAEDETIKCSILQ